MNAIFEKIRYIRARFLWGLQPSLLTLVKKEKKTTSDLDKAITSKSLSLWYSKFEFRLIILLFIVFTGLSHIQTIVQWSRIRDVIHYIGLTKPDWFNDFFVNYVLLKDSSHYQNIIAIHAGIGAVLIALAFFIAQALVNSEEPYRGVLLLRRSKFFNLLFAEVIFFFQFMWGSINIFGLIPLIVIGIFTIVSLYRSIELMVNSFKLRKEEENLFFEVIKNNFLKILDQEITKRIGQNVLSEKISKMGGIISMNPFVLDDSQYYVIKTDEEGVVANIEMSYLSILASKFSKSYTKFSVNEESTSATNQSSLDEAPCRLIPHFNSNLNYHSKKLFLIKKTSLRKEEDYRSIEKLVKKIFHITPEVDTESEARDQMIKLKIRCSNAIRDLKTDEVDKVTDFYLDLIKDFYSVMDLYGGGFSELQARTEINSFPNSKLKPLEWLFSDIRELFEQAIQSKNEESIRYMAYLPMRFAHEAINHRDHLVFQEFLYFPQALYLRALQERENKNDRLADALIDRAWRYTKELSTYHLEPKTEQLEFPADDLESLATHIVKVFQNLMYYSLENQDILSFTKFLEAIGGVFKYHSYLSRGDDGEEKHIYSRVNAKKQEMLFGLASWILFKFQNDKNSLFLREAYRQIVQILPKNIVEFTKVFLSVHDFKKGDYWGWGHWESKLYTEGEVHSVQILEKLEMFFAVNSLILLQSKTSTEIEAILLPHNRDLAFLAEGIRDLVKILDRIDSNSADWSFVLAEEGAKKVSDFKNILNKAREAQDKEDMERVRAAAISHEKIEVFKKGFIKNYEESKSVFIILKQLGLIEDDIHSEYKGKSKRIGINTTFDKTAFFDNDFGWHIHHMGIETGFDFGRAIAYGENAALLKEIEKKCTKSKFNDFQKCLDAFQSENILILATDAAIWSFLRLQGAYIPEWHTSFSALGTFPKGIEGVYKNKKSFVPVYEIAIPNSNKEAIYILDKRRLGKLERYSPLKTSNSAELIVDAVSITIEEFTSGSKLIKEFIKKPPSWLKEVGSIEQQEDYLKEKVLIKVLERFQFFPHKDFKGYVLKNDVT